MAFRFAVKTGENELTSCAAVLGALGVRWDCCPQRRRPAKPRLSGPQKGRLGVLGVKIDRYVVERHFSGIWKRAGGLRPGGLGTRFRRPLRRAVDPKPTSALLLARRPAPFGGPPPPHPARTTHGGFGCIVRRHHPAEG